MAQVTLRRDSVDRLIIKAISQPLNAVRHSLRHVEWDCAGNCEEPVYRSLFARADALTRSRVVRTAADGPAWAELWTRCRRCNKCRAYKARMWMRRASAELAMAGRTWFSTFTLAPEVHARNLALCRAEVASNGCDFDALPVDEQFRQLCSRPGRELTKYLKRVRKESRGSFRYLLVAERHKSGQPHWHMLLHEYADGPPVKWDTLSRQWRWGFSQHKLVKDQKAGLYVCKYISKSAATRVRGSARYGSSSHLKWPNCEAERGQTTKKEVTNAAGRVSTSILTGLTNVHHTVSSWLTEIGCEIGGQAGAEQLSKLAVRPADKPSLPVQRTQLGSESHPSTSSCQRGRGRLYEARTRAGEAGRDREAAQHAAPAVGQGCAAVPARSERGIDDLGYLPARDMDRLNANSGAGRLARGLLWPGECERPMGSDVHRGAIDLRSELRDGEQGVNRRSMGVDEFQLRPGPGPRVGRDVHGQGTGQRLASRGQRNDLGRGPQSSRAPAEDRWRNTAFAGPNPGNDELPVSGNTTLLLTWEELLAAEWGPPSVLSTSRPPAYPGAVPEKSYGTVAGACSACHTFSCANAFSRAKYVAMGATGEHARYVPDRYSTAEAYYYTENPCPVVAAASRWIADCWAKASAQAYSGYYVRYLATTLGSYSPYPKGRSALQVGARPSPQEATWSEGEGEERPYHHGSSLELGFLGYEYSDGNG